MTIKNQLQLRRGTSSEWTIADPVLVSGEPGFETDTSRLKIGTGNTWLQTKYCSIVPTGLIAGSGINIDLTSNWSSATISVSGTIDVDVLSNVSGIFFDTSVGTVDQVAGQLNWNNEAGTLDVGLTENLSIHIGQSVLYRVKNSTDDTLLKGQPVAVTGVLGGGEVLQVAPFCTDQSIDEIRFIGLVAEDIADGDDGFVVNFGHVKNVDLRTTNTDLNPNGETWVEGDILYVDSTSSGGLTKVKPKDAIYVAMVLAKNQNGELFVRITDRGHLDDLHDVSTGGVSNNQYLIYNSGTQLWSPTSSGIFNALSVDTSDNSYIYAKGTGIDISASTSLDLSSSVDVNIDFGPDGGLFQITNESSPRVTIIDNGYVGINTTSPNAYLDVAGDILAEEINIESSVNGATLFNIEGTNGNLFSVVDSVSGSLLSVNDITGLPAFEVFSDHKIVAGRFNQNDFVVSSSGNVGIGTNSPSTKLEVSGSITSTSFVKSGGTSSQFLKADGSVDSSTYLTSQTSHADVVVDGDFTSEGLMKRGASAGSYSIITDNSSNWNTAYGWGNHASAGYQSASTALTTSTSFGGDVSGSYNNIVVADDSHNHIIGNVDGLQTALDGKVAKSGDTMTGALTLSGDPSSSLHAATKQYVDNILATNNAMIFKGSIGTGGIASLPTSFEAGWTYVVTTQGTYANQVCEQGDLIIATIDRASGGTDADWIVVQTNINGAVVGPAISTSGNFPVFNGNTGKLIANSTYGPDNFIRSDTSDDFSGLLAHNNPGGTAFHIRGGGNSRTTILRVSAADANENISSNASSDYGFNIIYRGDLSGLENALTIEADNQLGTAVESLRIKQDGVVYFNSTPYVGSNVIWHAGNDGTGSTLDADLLDGNHASAFYLATNPNGYTTNTGTVTSVAALTLGTTGTDVSSTVTNGTTTPVITLNIPTASASNRGALSSTDWTTFNNKVGDGYYSQTNAIFGQQGIKHSFIDNVLYSAADRFDFYVDGVLSTDNSLFNAVYDQYPYQLSLSQTKVFRLVLNTKGNSTNGITYAPGHVYLSFYYTRIPNSVSGRVKDKDGVWRDLINWTNVSVIGGRAVWRGEIPNHNYMIEIELTVVGDATVSTWLSQIEYVMIRPGQFELGSINKAQDNTLWRNISFRNNSNATTLSLNSDGSAVFNEAGNDVDFRIEGDNNTNLFFVDAGNDRIGIGTNAPSHRLQLGTNTSTSTATPETISLGGTFSSSAGANAKLRLWTDGSNLIGLGVSSNQLDYVCSSNYSHVFYNNGSETWRITSAGILQSNGAETIQTSTGNLTLATAAGNGNIILSPHGTGNVGIGTTSTIGKLHIKGSASSNSQYYSQLVIESDGTYPNTIAGISLNSIGSDQCHIRFLNNGTAKFQIRYNEADTTSDKLTFYSFSQNADLVAFDGSNGFVGIGTTSPGVKLDVRGTAIITNSAGSNYNENLRLPESSSGYVAIHMGGAASSTSGTGSNQWAIVKNNSSGSHRFEIRHSNTAVITALVGGNVGIGTTTPSEKLEVNGNIKFTTGPKLVPSDVGNLDVVVTVAGHGGIKLKNETTNGGTFRVSSYADATASNTSFRIRDDNAGLDRLVIDTNGNVGIGTTTPGEKLEVNGNIKMLAGSYIDWGTSLTRLTDDISNGRTAIRTRNNILDILNSAGSGWGTLRADTITAGITVSAGLKIKSTSGVGTSDYISLAVGNNGGTEAIRIINSGYVGINTSTPTYNLQVNGSFGATTKSFRIDHPSRPNYTLEYGSLESPYHGVRLTGRGKVVKGVCVVDLPPYLKDLIHDDENINIQITNLKHGKTLYVGDIDLNNSQFVVKCDRAKTLPDLEFFWTFTGVRKDVPSLVVEQEK